MVYKPHKKVPFVFYFLSYWAYYEFIWVILASLAIYVVYLLKGGTASFITILFSSDNIAWLGFLPPMLLNAYNTVGTMVDSVIIHSEEKKITIIHYPLFFWKREITYFLDESMFECSYRSEKKSFKSIMSRWSLSLFWNSMIFHRKGLKNMAILNDTCGWNSYQLEEIYSELNKFRTENQTNQ